MELDQPLCQRQPEPQSAVATIQAGVQLTEGLEQERDCLWRHTNARVHNLDHRALLFSFGVHSDQGGPASAGELGRVL